MSIARRPIFWLLGMTALYALVFGVLVTWKYTTFGYNVLDLAIFNQTMWASVHGHPFAASIHEPSYLGDHASPALLLLAPFYWVWPSPLLLLLLQVAAVAVTALPLYGLSRHWLPHRPWWALLAPLLYLLNPFVHYATLFEFEFFLFAVPTLLGALWAWQTARWKLFVVLCVAALLVREDVALVGLALAGIIWWTDRGGARSYRWWLTPLLLSLAWGVAGWFITAHYTPAGQYKFLIYYNWLGDSVGSILTTAFTRPWQVLSMLLRWRNIELALLMLLPWCFLPLRAARWLWLGVPSFLLYALSSNGATLIVLQTHYGSFINASLAVATAAAIAALVTKPATQQRLPLPLIAGILLLTPIYLIAILGILPRMAVTPEQQLSYQQALAIIPSAAPVAASNSLLTAVSSRQHVSALVYAFLGRQQFSALPYTLPDKTEYVVFDGLDVVLDHWRYAHMKSYQEVYPGAAARLRQQLAPFGVVGIFDTTLVWQRGSLTPPPVAVTTAVPHNVFTCQPITTTATPFTNFSCAIQFQSPPVDDYQLSYVAMSQGAVVAERLLPLAYGLYRTSQLLPEQRLTTIYQLAESSLPIDRVCVELQRVVGRPTLNYVGSAEPRILSRQTIASSCW